MHVNNEIGSVQPIDKIGRIIHQYRKPESPLIYHVDGVQSFAKLPVDIGGCGIDLYSMSSHKIHGPMGCGALYISNRIELNHL